MPWVGPFRLRDYLDRTIEKSQRWPPEAGGVYVVSRRRWRGKPRREAEVLYVGSNTGRSRRFRTRIGDLIADMLGFWGDETGHHSGGIHLWELCYQERVNPLDLFLGWREKCRCVTCAENDAFEKYRPSVNRRRPKRCSAHRRDAR